MTQSKFNDSDDKTVWNSDITMSDISTGDEIEDALDKIVVDVEEEEESHHQKTMKKVQNFGVDRWVFTEELNPAPGAAAGEVTL